MARHGIPKIYYSDNCPQFSSREFNEYACHWNFHHKTSSPIYAQSNDLVECNVLTVKNMLKKAVMDSKDIMSSLIRIRLMMPHTGDMPNPETNPSIQTDLAAGQQTQKKQYYDRQAKELTPL
ncbi:hypothetical protein PR048_002288 [Dryococelus australis]|uniref:Integrase catalytic domain-containing protein n=1 Tax=Dryococelus australis TaxID=614101 RepID=A0ABQ9IJR9_9NEOP|nr:hypothetical protein PR048_002288 [Dryococelus australis]